jgi:hypothetical protein
MPRSSNPGSRRKFLAGLGLSRPLDSPNSLRLKENKHATSAD